MKFQIKDPTSPGVRVYGSSRDRKVHFLVRGDIVLNGNWKCKFKEGKRLVGAPESRTWSEYLFHVEEEKDFSFYNEILDEAEKFLVEISTTSEVVSPRTWSEFRSSGMLWFVNRILHVFGWAIVVKVDPDSGNTIESFPARVKYRGFSDASEIKGFRSVSNFMKEESSILSEEASKA